MKKDRVPIFKLWHKVFLVALVFVMAAVSITASTISRPALNVGRHSAASSTPRRPEVPHPQ